MVYKTPGVYTEEISLLPPSVAAVATAIPAFVGYTKADKNGTADSLRLKPTRIVSLLEYRQLFENAVDLPSGTSGFVPTTYKVILEDGNDNILEVRQLDGANERRFHLYNTLRHYFDNGGGPCYIVSVGSYSDAVALGTDTTGLQGGLKAVEKYDEPTLLLFPDAVELSAAELATLQSLSLAQCNKLQDRFSVFDLREGFKKAAPGGSDPVAEFRNRVGVNNLKYGAAYYPWLFSTYGTEIPIDKLTFARNSTPNTLLTNVQKATLGAAQLPAETSAALQLMATTFFTSTQDDFSALAAALVLPAGNTLSSPFRALYDQLVNKYVSSTVNTPATVQSEFLGIFRFLQSCATVFVKMEAPPKPTLATAVASFKTSTALKDAVALFIAIEKNAAILSTLMPAARTAATVDGEYGPLLNNSGWVTWPVAGTTVPQIAADVTVVVPPAGPPLRARGGDVLRSAALLLAADVLLTAADKFYSDALLARNGLEKQLFAQHPWFRGLATRLQQETSLLPASGAVAGLYASIDRARGVWKAPANVSLNAVIGPAVKLDDREQDDLNMHTTGKSVNAIRSFTGKGTLVWGARTLAGNDNEWRYVPVRRFFIFAEESIKKATEPFVFEPNDANTWVRVRAMIENFLVVQWRAGALAGAKPEHAFYVKIGLGETMTALDILEGRMVVEIGMAVVRPAEFIILRFAHKMQES